MSARAEALVDEGYEAAELLGRQYTRIVGKVIPWDTPTNVGLYVEEWRRGAFTRSLTKQPKIPLLPFHDGKQIPVAISEAWSDEATGLYGIFKVVMTAAAQVMADYAAQGIVSGLSIGFSPEESKWHYAAAYDPDRGPKYMDRVVRTQARLLEVSLVSTPAYVDAAVVQVDSRASLVTWQVLTNSGSWLWCQSDDPDTDYPTLEPGDWPVPTLGQALIRSDHLAAPKT